MAAWIRGASISRKKPSGSTGIGRVAVGQHVEGLRLTQRVVQGKVGIRQHIGGFVARLHMVSLSRRDRDLVAGRIDRPDGHAGLRYPH